MAAFVLTSGMGATPPAAADPSARTLSLYHAHTKESLTITFKRNGRYDTDALKRLNHFLRDWRNNDQIRMDPKLFDIIWEVYRDVGGREPVQIVSSYRSPKTNAMLRSRSSAVAKNSQHMLGKAIDFRIPGVDAARLRVAGLKLQQGGVGYYASSNFVHLDTGSVRHWPRMSRQQLARVFPDGRTVHIPSDGKPLEGYQVALADMRRERAAPSRPAAAETAPSGGGLLARIFRGGGEQPAEPTRVATAAARPVPAPQQQAPALPVERPAVILARATLAPTTQEPAKELPVEVAAAFPQPRPQELQMRWRTGPQPAATTTPASGAVAIASLAPAFPAPRPGGSVADAPSTPVTAYAPAALPEVPSPLRTAALTTPSPQPRAATTASRPLPNATTASIPATATLTAPPALTAPAVRLGSLAPSRFARAPEQAALHHPTPAQGMLHMPSRVIAIGFGGDPTGGLRSDVFRGRAIAFLPTVRLDLPRQPHALASRLR